MFRQAGAIACLVVCGACAQVALVSVTPIVAALARNFDQRTANVIVELDKKQDWPGMLALAQGQLQRAPDRPEWWVLQGYALARQGQHAAAVESYRRALRLSPEDESTWLALGQSQSESGNDAEAVKAYKQALRYRPESAPAYLALADLHLRRGEPDLALPNYRESVRYEPELESGWIGLASAYQVTGQFERRDQALQVLRKLDPAAADRLAKQFGQK
jgi:tetratricopeptide (TPR) repeat protein